MKNRFILMLFSLLILSGLSAQENLDTLLRIALENNPGLNAKFNKYRADLQKVPQAGSLPDPDVSFGYFINPMELISGNQVAQIQVMQMFPWFGTLKASKDEASLMALSSLELFNAEKQEISYSIRINYYQLYLNKKQTLVYDTSLVLLKSIEQLLLVKLKSINIENTKRSSDNQMLNKPVQMNSSMGMNANQQQKSQAGNAPMNNAEMGGSSSVLADLIRVQVEIKELEDNMAFLKNQKLILLAQLNTLLNRDKATEIFIPDEIEIPEFDFENQALFDSIKAVHPMLKMNRAEIEAYKKQQVMNRKMSYPMVGIGLNYSVINKSEMSASEMNGKDMFMPMVNLKLPIYRKKYKASIKEAEYLENSATDELTNKGNMLNMQLSEYQIAMRESKRSLNLYRDIISLTQKSFDIMLVQYSSSGADFDAIIRLQRQLLDYRLNMIKARVEQLTAIAGLRKLLNQY